MDDFYKTIVKIRHIIHSISVSPLSNEKFWVLRTLDNSKIFPCCISRFGGIEI
jgi:hypothetical protein